MGQLAGEFVLAYGGGGLELGGLARDRLALAGGLELATRRWG
ncbi:MAG TPA: hypothetical protein VHN14_04080 [Kofleriaceae bacterium]|nr:hypothetical protein [Kofleriaceae bacterium]